MNLDARLNRDEQRDLRNLVLDLLRCEEPLPISTNQIADVLGLSPFHRSVYLWRILDKLARHGDVERLVLPEFRCRYWRLTPSRWDGQS